MQFGKAQVASNARDDGPADTPAAGRVSDAQEVQRDDYQKGWFIPLSKPVTLPGGLALKTLSDAGAYILGLPDHIKRRDSWESAADLILRAAAGTATVADATAQIELALALDLAPAALAPTAPQDRQAQASPALRRSPKGWFSASWRKPETGSSIPNRDDKARKGRHALAAANAAVETFCKNFSWSLVKCSPVWHEIARLLQRCKAAVLIFLRLQEDAGRTFFDRKVIRRGLYFGLASALMLGGLLMSFLQQSTTSPVLVLIICGVTSVLALLSVSAMLIINLID
jgi:hypothetical protein